MRAAIYEEFRGPVEVHDVADPSPPPAGAVLRVEATGICRSDWHGWMGHDPEITLPHVPGHEIHDNDRPRARTISTAFGKCRSCRLPERISSPMMNRPILIGSDAMAAKCVCRCHTRQVAVFI